MFYQPSLENFILVRLYAQQNLRPKKKAIVIL